MNNLWTPWRMPYISGQEKKTEACIFDAAKNQSHNREKLILFRNHAAVVLLNRFPYANGHLLVAPSRHVADLSDLDDTEAEQLMAMIRKSTAILKSNMQPDGFNIGLNLGKTAGAGLADHLHFHIVPRWHDDHNFMSIVADVRIIPELIERTFDRLIGDFHALVELNNQQPSI